MNQDEPELVSLLCDAEVMQFLEARARTILGRNRSPGLPETMSLVNRTIERLLANRSTSSTDQKLVSRSAALGYFTCAMRHVLIDLVRQRKTIRHGAGGNLEQLATDDSLVPPVRMNAHGLSELFDALNALSTRYPNAGRIVELRFYFEMNWDEVAAETKLSKSKARAEWELGKAWLMRELKWNK